MGLSVMEDAPSFEQAMRFANQAGSFQHVAPTMWVGEQTLGGLGLGDQQATADTIRAVGDAGAQIAAAFGQLKKGKKGAPAPAAYPAIMNSSAPAGGFDSGSLTKWLIIGGIVIAGGIVLMKVLKKKKKVDAPEHKEGE